jgi:hypothetical protein
MDLKPTSQHVLETEYRKHYLELWEFPDKIIIKISADKYGFLGDEDEHSAWLQSILDPLDIGERTVIMQDPVKGDMAISLHNTPTIVIRAK